MTPIARALKKWIWLAAVVAACVVTAGCVPIDGVGIAIEQSVADDKVRGRQADDASTYFDQGLTRVGNGKYEEAIAAFDRAIELRPDYADAYVNRGVARAYLGQYEEAVADFDQALQLQPQNAFST